MSHAPDNRSQFDGCTGTCMQGRRPCDCREELANGTTRRFDGTSRNTRPGELLPTSPDRAEGVSVTKAAGIALGLVALCLVLALAAHAIARNLSGAPL